MRVASHVRRRRVVLAMATDEEFALCLSIPPQTLARKTLSVAIALQVCIYSGGT